MRKYISLVLVLLLALVVSGCFLKPPPTNAVLTGKVVVSSGAVRGATVNIIDPKTGGIVATTTTDAEGNYQVEVPQVALIW